MPLSVFRFGYIYMAQVKSTKFCLDGSGEVSSDVKFIAYYYVLVRMAALTYMIEFFLFPDAMIYNIST